MTVGGLVAFNMLAGRLAQPVLRLAQLWQDLQQTGISVARLGDILNTQPDISRSATQLPAIQGAIEFDDVHFRYRPEASEVLRGVSFRLKPGEVLGIVGRSGCGKSTLAKLVQRLYVPSGAACWSTAWISRSPIRRGCAGRSASCCRRAGSSRARSARTSRSPIPVRRWRP